MRIRLHFDTSKKEIYRFGSFRMDCRLRTVHRDGQAVRLTSMEFDILRVLVRGAPDAVPNQKMFEEVWPNEPGTNDTNLRPHIRAIRSALGKNDAGGEYISNARLRHFITCEVTRESNDATNARWISGSLAGLAVLCLLVFYGRGVADSGSRNTRLGKLLNVSTSEGHSPRRYAFPETPRLFGIHPDGSQVYALNFWGQVLMVLDVASGLVRSMPLPIPGGPLVVSPSGKIYISSPVGGVMTFDFARSKLLADVIPTGSGVIDMALDPASGDLWLAMAQNGLARLSPSTRRIQEISKLPCPVGVAVDHAGKRVYVSYQCGGPGGHKGHDAIGVFDTHSGASLGVASGPPMVGGSLAISADDKLVAATGADACTTPAYDHVGCPFVPGNVVNLLRTEDLRFVRTAGLAQRDANVTLAGDDRLVILGHDVAVYDTGTLAALERFDLHGQLSSLAVLSPDHKRLWVNSDNDLLAFELDRANSRAGLPVPAMSFPGDGTYDDAQGFGSLAPTGSVHFVPALQGQAFSLDGVSSLAIANTGYYSIKRHNYSISMLVRAEENTSDEGLLDWKERDRPVAAGIRLKKLADGRVSLRVWPGSELISQMRLEPKHWQNIIIAKSDQDISLYVDGAREASGSAQPEEWKSNPPLIIGNFGPVGLGHRMRGWKGELDEIELYNRALSGAEVRVLASRVK